MAKANKVKRGSDSRLKKGTPYPLASCRLKVLEDVHRKKKRSKSSEKKEWDDATCSVCMEYPHNAVLLLCSSYNKGCRPYMCATSFRYSNCLEQYKKAYTKVNSTQVPQLWNGSTDGSDFATGLDWSNEKMELPELLCPLCRGQVKGWTVVEKARKYLNTKKRTCMQDNCSFVGNYKELRKHMRADHPWARPREVDPTLAEKWKKLENEREQNDVMSTIRSSMPGAIVMGDYVIEGNYRGLFRDYNVDDYLGDVLSRLESYGGARNDRVLSRGIFERGYRLLDEEDGGTHRAGTVQPVPVTHHRNRFLLGVSRRRRRRHGATNEGR